MYLFKSFCLLLFLCICGCTENPFFKDEIKASKELSFKGNIHLPDSDDHSGILVYFEGLDIFSETDKDGNFEIELPVSPKFQPGQGLTGFYNVYYYILNYRLQHSTVFLNKGEFVFGVADLNNEGEIVQRIFLKKLLDVQTSIDPELILENYSGNVTITVRLENKVDSVIVFSHVNKKKYLSSVFLKEHSILTDDIYMLYHTSNLVAITVDTVLHWTMELEWLNETNNIQVGFYEVIPYLYVYQQDIPSSMLDKLGVDVTSFTPDYLKMPFRRKSAKLSILKDFN